MFSLNKDSVILEHINTRTEKHGDEDVTAIDLKFSISLHNSKLNDFSPGLRESLYSADDRQGDLVDPHHMPNLRHSRLLGFGLNYDMTAVRLAIYEDGTNDEQMIFTGCKAKNFKFMPKDGGSVPTTFTVQVTDPDPEYFGALVQLLKCAMKIDLEQITVQAEDAAGAEQDKKTQGMDFEGVKEQAEQAQLDKVAEAMKNTEPTPEEQAELDRLDAEAAKVVKARGAKANLKAV